MRAKKRNAARAEKFKRLRQIRKMRWKNRAWKLAEQQDHLATQTQTVLEKLKEQA